MLAGVAGVISTSYFHRTYAACTGALLVENPVRGAGGDMRFFFGDNDPAAAARGISWNVRRLRIRFVLIGHSATLIYVRDKSAWLRCRKNVSTCRRVYLLRAIFNNRKRCVLSRRNNIPREHYRSAAKSAGIQPRVTISIYFKSTRTLLGPYNFLYSHFFYFVNNVLFFFDILYLQ